LFLSLGKYKNLFKRKGKKEEYIQEEQMKGGKRMQSFTKYQIS